MPKLSLILPLSVLTLRLTAGELSAEDRQRLLVHFEMTGDMLATEIRGLSKAQLEYRAAGDRWTIRECVSHLAISEPDYWRDLMTAVKAAPDMAGKKSAHTDADILWYGMDRVQPTKTGGGHEKVETFKDVDQALDQFRKLRATMLEYIKSTKDDMRAHSFGKRSPIDCWQWMLEISTHSQRHIMQVREIKADSKFPKS